MTRVFHPTLNTSMCHIRTQNGTNLMENTFAFHWAGGPPSASELESLATLLAQNVGESMRDFTSNGWVFREIYCRNIHEEVAAEGTYVYPPNTTGRRTGGQVAASEACGIVKRTGLTGRGQHGRNSISGFIEGDVDGNSVSSQLITFLISLAAKILISYLTARFVPAVAHIPRLPGAPDGTSTILREAVVLDNNIDSQKTRLNAHGR